LYELRYFFNANKIGFPIDNNLKMAIHRKVQNNGHWKL